jgi:hypothetical protein
LDRVSLSVSLCHPIHDLALIEVAQTRQSGAVIADVAHLQGEVAGEGVRDTEAPIGDVRVFEIRVHRKQIADSQRSCRWTACGRGGRDCAIHSVIPVY